MSPPPERHVRHLLQGLDDEAFRAFLADLWDARGWETRVDGDHVVATREDPDELVRLRPYREGTLDSVHSAPDVGDRVTTVVTDGSGSQAARAAAFDADADLLGATDLYHAVRHGLDAAAREDLLERHFGRAAFAADDTLRGRVSRGSAALRSNVPEVAGALVALVLVFLLVGAAVGGPALNALPLLGTPGEGDDPGSGAGGTTTLSTTADPATTAGSETATADPKTTATEPEPEQLAPGLTSEGITDPARLLEAHRSHLENASFRRVVLRKGDERPRPENGSYSDGFTWSRDVVTVDGEEILTTERRVDADENASASGSTWAGYNFSTPRSTVYVNGTGAYHRIQFANETKYRVYDAEYIVVPTPRDGSLLRDFLRSQNSSVVGTTTRNGTQLHVVVVSGDTPENAPSDLTGGRTTTVLVDSSGFVHEMRTTYVYAVDLPLSESKPPLVSSSVVVRYSGLGNTTVTKPEWVDEAARNGARVG